MLIGCHVSIRHGYLAAAQTAHRLGAAAFQYFPKNPRSLAVKQPNAGDARQAAEYARLHGLVSVAHAPYPTNPAVEDARREAVVRSILNDLAIAETCGSLGVVVHFGKFYGKDPLQGYQNILQCLNKVLSEWRGQALVLLENQAGQGGAMGTTVEEAVQIRKLCVRPEGVGFCFDTCHAFASGMWPGKQGEMWEDHARKAGYLTHLKAVHLNDSAFPQGSRRDRHANIGTGCIHPHLFKRLAEIPELEHVPFILETPALPNGGHRREMEDVKRLCGR